MNKELLETPRWVLSCPGLIQVITVVEVLTIQESHHAWKVEFLSTPHLFLALTFFPPSLPRCRLSLRGGGIDYTI